MSDLSLEQKKEFLKDLAELYKKHGLCLCWDRDREEWYLYDLDEGTISEIERDVL